MRPLGRKFGSEVPSNLSSSAVVSAPREACSQAPAHHLSGRHLATPSEVTGRICRAFLGARPPCFQSFVIGGRAHCFSERQAVTFDIWPCPTKKLWLALVASTPDLHVNENLNKSVLMLAFKWKNFFLFLLNYVKMHHKIFTIFFKNRYSFYILIKLETWKHIWQV